MRAYIVFASFLALIGLVILVSIRDAPAQSQPNIIFIMTDDQDLQSLDYMPKTKALLGDKGVTFSNAFVQFPLCCPTRATMLSGQYSHNNGVRGNLPAWNGGYQVWSPTEGNSLGPWMQAAGYSTAFLGKNMNGYEFETYRVPVGWTRWRGLKEWDYWNWSIYVGDGTIKHNDNRPTEYLTDNQAIRGTALIRSATQPFMNLVWTFAPHIAKNGSGAAVPAGRHLGTFDNVPVPHTPAFNSTHTTGKHPIVASFPVMNSAAVANSERVWRRNIESLQAVDDLVEDIVDQLTVSGLINNTYIIYTSDNGNLHGEWKKYGKLLPYERSIRVPLIIRGPGIPAGVVRNELVVDADITATILDWGNAAYGRTLDGKSLVPLLSTNTVAWRSALFLTGLYDTSGIYDQNFTRWNAIRTATRKYIRASDGFEELYDLQADLWERFSVVNDPFYAADLISLRALELQQRTCSGTSCWVP